MHAPYYFPIMRFIIALLLCLLAGSMALDKSDYEYIFTGLKHLYADSLDEPGFTGLKPAYIDFIDTLFRIPYPKAYFRAGLLKKMLRDHDRDWLSGQQDTNEICITYNNLKGCETLQELNEMSRDLSKAIVDRISYHLQQCKAEISEQGLAETDEIGTMEDPCFFLSMIREHRRTPVLSPLADLWRESFDKLFGHE